MIRFFRQIRQSLILPGTARKYLLYAFGEIFLVVFGILIALQLDDWYSNVKEKRIAQDYVERLISDLRTDTLVFSTYMDRSYKHNIISNKVYNLYLGEDHVFDNSSEALISIQSIGRSLIPSVRTNTYQDLISTGNIRLIKDKSVSDEIIQYYNYPYYDWFMEYKSRLWNGYLPLAIDLLDLKLLEDILITEQNDPNILLPEDFKIQVPESIAQAKIAELRNTPAFDFHTKNVARTHLLNAHVLSGMHDNATGLLQKLDAYRYANYGGQ